MFFFLVYFGLLCEVKNYRHNLPLIMALMWSGLSFFAAVASFKADRIFPRGNRLLHKSKRKNSIIMAHLQGKLTLP